MRVGAWFKQAWVAIFLAAGLGYIAYYFHALAPRATLATPLVPGFLLLAATLQIANFLSYAQLWRAVLATVSTGRLTLTQSLTQIVLMGIGKYLPGKIWGMIARGAHGQHHGIKGKATLIATYYEQAMLLHAAALVCTLLIAWLHQQYWLAAAGIASLFLGPALLTWLRIALVWLAHHVRRMQSPPPLDRLPLRSYMSLTLAYAAIWLMSGAVLAAIYLACFDRPLTTEMLGTLTLANTAGITAGFLALFAPGGIGVREAVTSTLLMQHMSLADAALLSVVYRLWLVAWDLVLGGLFAFYQMRSRRP
jgi:hypothetical protein